LTSKKTTVANLKFEMLLALLHACLSTRLLIFSIDP